MLTKQAASGTKLITVKKFVSMNLRFTVNTWLRSVRELEISQNVRLYSYCLKFIGSMHQARRQQESWQRWRLIVRRGLLPGNQR